MSRSAEVGLATLCGLAVVAITGTEIVVTVVILSALVVASVIVTLFRSKTRVSDGGGGVDDRMATAFAVAWLVIVLAPAHQFSHRSIAAAVETPAVESMTEFMYFGLAGVLAVTSVRAMRRGLGSTFVTFPWLGLPLFAAMSFLWSATFLYSFGRGVQLLMTAVLAWGTANIGMTDPAFLRTLLERFGRWYIRVTCVLIVLGVLLGPLYSNASAGNLERFAWIGTHPVGAAWIVGSASVLIVALPSEVSRLGGATRLVALCLVGYATYAAHSRTALVALAVAFAYLLLNAARRSPLYRYVSLPYALTGVAIVAFYFRDELLEYFYRDQSAEKVSGGNGRNDLWSDAFRLLETPFDWIFGLGYGMSRQVFLPGKPWANSAHSSVLGIFVNLGIIGLALLAIWIAHTLVVVLRARLHESPIGNALMAILLYSLVDGFANETVSFPGRGHAIVMLVGASAMAILRAPPGSWEHLSEGHLSNEANRAQGTPDGVMPSP